MIRQEIIIRSGNGLPISSAGELAEHTMRYHSVVTVTSGNKQASARSLLGLVSLGIREGTKLTICCDGPDEKEALKGTVEFFETLA